MSTETDLTGIDMSGYGAQPEPTKAPEAAAEKAEPDTPKDDDEAGTNVNDELQLTDDDELAPEGDEEGEKGKKPRHKSAKERIDEITKARREAERRAEAAEARLAAVEAGKPPAPTTVDIGDAPDPSDEKYEFGEADPKYIADLARHEVRKEMAEERAKEQAVAHQRQLQAAAEEANTNWQKLAETGQQKYEDFTETVVESAAAKEWPLLPLSALAVASSDSGDEIAYHLATNRDEAKKLAELELKFHQTRDEAMKLGLPDQVVALFVQPHLDRATEYFESIEAKVKAGQKAAKPEGKKVTTAPEPPKHSVRGSGGKFSPDFTANDCDLDSLAKALK